MGKKWLHVLSLYEVQQAWPIELGLPNNRLYRLFVLDTKRHPGAAQHDLNGRFPRETLCAQGGFHHQILSRPVQSSGRVAQSRIDIRVGRVARRLHPAHADMIV